MQRRVQTGTVPLAVVATYYRRDLRIPPGSARSRRTPVAGRRHEVRIAVAESPDDALRSGAVDVTVVELSPYAAYLEPVTGMGVLVCPTAEAYAAGLRERNPWTTGPDGRWPEIGFTVQEADQLRVLERLADAGWTLLETDGDSAQVAGYTLDGRRAACLYAERSTYEQLVLEDLHRAFAALQAAAALRPGSR
ncbi:hypothetical protein [Kribbella sp. CA-247076]|uniref:hypothetical protein n=1 Tax=Kribbella sp. CA-247076 TaxID=3239941 RepID=UPI003D8E426B